MANPTSTAQPAAIPFDSSSPAVRALPELLGVHRLAETLHSLLLSQGDDLPLVLSGWVRQEAAGHLAEARAALWHCVTVIEKGERHHAIDREAGL
jgi:hypothetical protein